MLVDQELGGEVYNIGADAQKSNIALTHAILEIMGKDESSIDYVTDRLGHDFRYAVDSSKIRSLGWKPQHSFEDRLADTVAWYTDRSDWWRPLKDAR